MLPTKGRKRHGKWFELASNSMVTLRDRSTCELRGLASALTSWLIPVISQIAL